MTTSTEEDTDIPSAEFAGMLIVENGRVSYNKISLLQESDLVALMPSS